MSHTMPIEQLEQHLATLISTLSPGDEITLTADNLPVAKIISQRPPARRKGGSCKGMIVENPEIPDDIHLQDFKDYMQ